VALARHRPALPRRRRCGGQRLTHWSQQSGRGGAGLGRHALASPATHKTATWTGGPAGAEGLASGYLVTCVGTPSASRRAVAGAHPGMSEEEWRFIVELI